MYVGSKVEVAMLIVLQVYLNIVLDEALEEKPGGEKVRIGMVVIRGNAVVMLEVRLSRPCMVQMEC
jgi:small nuclear ribonucleoprotein G